MVWNVQGYDSLMFQELTGLVANPASRVEVTSPQFMGEISHQALPGIFRMQVTDFSPSDGDLVTFCARLNQQGEGDVEILKNGLSMVPSADYSQMILQERIIAPLYNALIPSRKA